MDAEAAPLLMTFGMAPTFRRQSVLDSSSVSSGINTAAVYRSDGEFYLARLSRPFWQGLRLFLLRESDARSSSNGGWLRLTYAACLVFLVLSAYEIALYILVAQRTTVFKDLAALPSIALFIWGVSSVMIVVAIVPLCQILSWTFLHSAQMQTWMHEHWSSLSPNQVQALRRQFHRAALVCGIFQVVSTTVNTWLWMVSIYVEIDNWQGANLSRPEIRAQAVMLSLAAAGQVIVYFGYLLFLINVLFLRSFLDIHIQRVAKAAYSTPDSLYAVHAASTFAFNFTGKQWRLLFAFSVWSLSVYGVSLLVWTYTFRLAAMSYATAGVVTTLTTLTFWMGFQMYFVGTVNARHEMLLRCISRSMLFAPVERSALMQRITALPLTIQYFSVTVSRGQVARLFLSLFVVMLPFIANIVFR